ncbi:DNA polymerase epsilon subunit B family protein [Cryptosporidium andersoni]|uniref:DNA polymerase alpha subunit B n=1 Tax=Cryptosporidium andersoni TaxID=117008 RepID=A0A1J4MSN5_9CRYT|nr:DNA polymerase epsilon subunit B family protein [Cryptosporidium andersoni]
MGSIDAGILYIYDPSVSLMSSIEGDSIIERIQRLLGDEYDNYKESFEAIYKSDPLKNPQKFLNHVEKYLSKSSSKSTSNIRIGTSTRKVIEPSIEKNKGIINDPEKNMCSYLAKSVCITSYSIGTTFLDEPENNNKDNIEKNIVLTNIYNENLVARKGCLTDKNCTKYYIENLVDSITEDCLWLDSDFEIYSRSISKRCQDLIEMIISQCSNSWLDESGEKYPIIPVGESRKQKVVVLGQIACDNESHLNEQSILLIGSRERSGGHTCELRIRSTIKDITLYPGQIVAVIGNSEVNEFGQYCFTADEFIGGLPPQSPKVTFKELSNSTELYAAQGQHPVQCIVFSGPFTNDKYLDFSYLTRILDYVSKEKPHVLILMGPFLDARNETINNADLYNHDTESFLSFENIYLNLFSNLISQFAKRNEKVKIYIVPSEYDVGHSYPIPQPSLEQSLTQSNFPSNIYWLTNPCQIFINDFKIYITSSDVVTPMANSMITRSELPLLDIILSQFLYQRSLFPYHPSHHPIDPRKLSRLTLSGELPHLILSSNTMERPFAKPILGYLFLNSGNGNMKTGISFFLYAPSKDQLMRARQIARNLTDALVPMYTSERIRVDIVEIT